MFNVQRVEWLREAQLHKLVSALSLAGIGFAIGVRAAFVFLSPDSVQVRAAPPASGVQRSA